MKLIAKLTPLMAAGVMLFAASTAQAAGTASFSVSGGGAHTVGTSFTVVVSENSGAQEVNAVDARVAYDASKLQVMGVSAGDFSTCPVAPGVSGGTVNFGCAVLGSKLTGAHTVGTITFKALTTGTTAASIAAGSAIVDANVANQNDWNGVLSGATYTLTNPSTPTPTNPATPTPAGTNTPASSPSPSATAKATVSPKPAVAGAATTPSPSATPEKKDNAAALKKASEDLKAMLAINDKTKVGFWIALVVTLGLIGGAIAWFVIRRNRAIANETK